MIVGRNDPCPCGSGKKYKKCHGGKEVVSINEVIDEQILQILEQFYSENPEQRDMFELNMYLTKWQNELKGFLPIDQVEHLAVDHFLFVKRQDIWNKYIERQLQKAVRPSIIKMLEQWKNPLVLIGEVIKIEDGFIKLKDVVDGHIYNLVKLDEMNPKIGEYAMSMFLPDSRQDSDAIMIISGIDFLPNWLKDAMKDVKAFAKKTKLSTQEFYNELWLECCVLLNKKSKKSQPAMTLKQVEMLTILEDFIEEYEIEEENLLNFFKVYLMKISPKPRKAESVVAGAISFGQEYLSIVEFPWTNKEIAEIFEVSTSTIQKYFEEMEEFFMAIDEEFEEEQIPPNVIFELGTYPRYVEFKNWELMKHLDTDELENEADLKAHLSKVMNKPYKPKNKEEEAQLNAYEGYFAETEKIRANHWKIAELLNPTNADVLLHQAEFTEDVNKAKELYKLAISEAKKQFDESFDIAWAFAENRPYLRALFVYGVWQFEKGNFKEANSYFSKLLKLNPNDNQGVRYIAVSTLLHLQKYKEAQQILHDYKDQNDPIIIYLFVYLQKLQNLIQGEMRELLEVNPFALRLLDDKPVPQAFPKSAAVAAGSEEEAQIIYTLLSGLV